MLNDSLVQKSLAKLSQEDRLIFQQAYGRKARSVGVTYALWFFLGWHYAYLGQWGMQFLYWISLGGVGIWALIDLFRIPGLVENMNRDLAIKTLHDLRLAADAPIVMLQPSPPSLPSA